MSINITQVLYSGLGGHASVVFPMIDASAQANWKNKIVFYGVEPVRNEYAGLCKAKGVEFDGIKKKRGADLNSFISVYRAYSKQRPDVILLHSPSLIVISILYSIFHRCKLVMVEHNANQIKSRYEWICSRIGMMFADRVVFLSHQYATEVKSHLGGGYRERKVEVIGNGLNLQVFRRFANAPVNEVVISMIGRFFSPKNQLDVLKFFHRIQQVLPQRKMKLVMPGSGPGLEQVQDYIDQHQVRDVSLPGTINEKEIAALLNSTTLYIHATDAETMSTAIMQAMACGAPVLASDVPGVTHLVKNGNGFTFKNHDPEDLFEKGLYLLENDEVRRNVATSALETSLGFSSEMMFRKYNSMIQSMMNK